MMRRPDDRRAHRMLVETQSRGLIVGAFAYRPGRGHRVGFWRRLLRRFFGGLTA
jgi:hypothetical protein